MAPVLALVGRHPDPAHAVNYVVAVYLIIVGAWPPAVRHRLTVVVGGEGLEPPTPSV